MTANRVAWWVESQFRTETLGSPADEPPCLQRGLGLFRNSEIRGESQFVGEANSRGKPTRGGSQFAGEVSLRGKSGDGEGRAGLTGRFTIPRSHGSKCGSAGTLASVCTGSGFFRQWGVTRGAAGRVRTGEGRGDAAGRFFAGGDCTMIAAPVPCDVDGIAEGAHSAKSIADGTGRQGSLASRPLAP